MNVIRLGRRMFGLSRVLALSAALLAGGHVRASDRLLRVGVDRDWAPHQFEDARRQPAGFDVELFRAVASAAGLQFEFVVADWPTLRSQLERGELDVVPGVFETPAREPLLDFTSVTAIVQHLVFVRSESEFRSVADLESGTRVLVAAAGPHDDLADRAPPGVVIERRASTPAALRALAAGEADAAVALDTLALYLIRSEKLPLRSLGPPLDTMKLRFAVPEGRDALLAELNDALVLVHVQGAWDRLYDDWFGVLRPRGLTLRQIAPGLGLLLGVLALAFGWSWSLRRQVALQTERIASAERDQRELERRMLRGEKMAALGRMAVGIAADFRNKLNVVQGNLELARAEPAPSEGLQDTISEIETATRSMAALVEELVVFGRGSDGERRLTSWNEIVRGSKAMLRRVVPASIAIDITLGNELGSVEADPSQLEQVVASLVLNACDSLGASGKVQVSTCAVGEGGAQWSELAVRDNGPGMDAARRERIFEPFFSSRGESRGLGLATVHAIAARQGGQVDVESSPGGGTCFRVRLPRVSP